MASAVGCCLKVIRGSKEGYEQHLCLKSKAGFLKRKPSPYRQLEGKEGAHGATERDAAGQLYRSLPPLRTTGWCLLVIVALNPITKGISPITTVYRTYGRYALVINKDIA